MTTMAMLGDEMSKKISLSEPSKSPKKASAVSLLSTSSNEDPPRKKSSLKENIANVIRSPNFILRREATKTRWDQVRDRLKLNRIKISIRERRKAYRSSSFIQFVFISFINRVKTIRKTLKLCPNEAMFCYSAEKCYFIRNPATQK
ncbi:unnamed protein product [Caenorhabditis bovis]|uniref:Uncharacterized protein n=1 Tax=Caenorhabditis bovis TaxID=2654633 RepID=A0A8S1EV72_9PELO|nr:unnamed protein product [Caenorhabditis bovis]